MPHREHATLYTWGTDDPLQELCHGGLAHGSYREDILKGAITRGQTAGTHLMCSKETGPFLVESWKFLEFWKLQITGISHLQIIVLMFSVPTLSRDLTLLK